MPVKVNVKLGSVEVNVEAENASEVEAVLGNVSDFVSALPRPEAAAPAVGTPTPLQVAPQPAPLSGNGNNAGLPERLAELVADAGLSPTDFRKIVSLADPAKPRILPRMRDGSGPERQRKAAAVIMAVASRTTGKEEWPVFELTEALKLSNVDPSELSKGLGRGEGPRFFRKTGASAGTKYALEVPGEELAIAVFRELLTLGRSLPISTGPLAADSQPDVTPEAEPPAQQ